MLQQVIAGVDFRVDQPKAQNVDLDGSWAGHLRQPTDVDSVCFDQRSESSDLH